jgi:hypothetical protein
MTAKEFFRQVRCAERELKIIKAKLEHYEDLGFSLGGAVGVIGNKQKGSSRVEMAAIGKVDVLRDLVDQQKEYMAIIARAEDIIRQVPQEKYRLILTYMYLLGKSPKWISDELEYNDPNSVYRAKGWALWEAQQIMNKKEKEDEKQ